jgi:hypothetical protein
VSTGQQKQENAIGTCLTTSEKHVQPCTRKSCISSSPNREHVKCESLDHKNSEDIVTRIATCHDISTICGTKFLPCTSPLHYPILYRRIMEHKSHLCRGSIFIQVHRPFKNSAQKLLCTAAHSQHLSMVRSCAASRFWTS